MRTLRLLLVLAGVWPRTASAAAEVELIEPGELPRQQLAYHFSLAPETIEVLWQSSSLVVRRGIPDDEQVAPLVVTTWKLDNQSRSPGGDLALELVLVSARAQPSERVSEASRQKADAQLGALQGTVCSGMLTPSGRVTVLCPPAATPEGNQLLARFTAVVSSLLAVPLPLVPVGRNAEWRVTRREVEGEPLTAGASVTTTYRLVQLDGEGFQVGQLSATSAPEQRLSTPVANDELAWLQELSGSGKGGSQHHLAFAAPARADHEYQRHWTIVTKGVSAKRQQELERRRASSPAPEEAIVVEQAHEAIRGHAP